MLIVTLLRDKLKPLGSVKIFIALIVSEKFANGKSRLLYGIYDAAKLVESKATSKKDYLILQEVFTKLVEQDPTLYEARIWLAKSTMYTNIDKAIEHINEAIKIICGSARSMGIEVKE